MVDIFLKVINKQQTREDLYALKQNEDFITDFRKLCEEDKVRVEDAIFIKQCDFDGRTPLD